MGIWPGHRGYTPTLYEKCYVNSGCSLFFWDSNVVSQVCLFVPVISVMNIL